MGLSQFDAEGVIGLSSPYKGTAERGRARLKSHIKTKKSVEFFLDGFQHSQQIAKNLLEFGLPYLRGFCSALSETAPDFYRSSFLYSPGVAPVAFLNSRIKYAVSLNPESMAMSVTEDSCARRSSLA